MRGQSIWILEDDKGCRFVYEQTLDYRYQTTYFSSLEEFKVSLQDNTRQRPSLIIADIMLQDGNFINFLRSDECEELLSIPFIVVSSIDDIDALRFCFREGALDYITKPFKKNELLVKIENIVNGYHQGHMWANQKSLRLDGQEVKNLTSKQLQLLSLFIKSPERSITRDDILKGVWGDTTVHPKTVDVHLYNLRRRLGAHGYHIRSEGGGRWSLQSDRLPEQFS
jgi:DNA-binding response OmpR family regulator